jgi:hypothetical protein
MAGAVRSGRGSMCFEVELATCEVAVKKPARAWHSPVLSSALFGVPFSHCVNSGRLARSGRSVGWNEWL